MKLIFIVDDGTQYKNVSQTRLLWKRFIEDINGDLDDFIWTPILLAEEVSNEEFENAFASKVWLVEGSGSKERWWRNYEPESCTWTFYNWQQ